MILICCGHLEGDKICNIGVNLIIVYSFDEGADHS